MERNDPYIIPCSFMSDNGMMTTGLVGYIFWTKQTTKELEEAIKDITKLDYTNSNLHLLTLDCINEIQRQYGWYMSETKYDISIASLANKVYDYVTTFQSIPTVDNQYLIDNCTEGNLSILLPMVERIQNGF